MPKITLKHKKTGKSQQFEPIDAKEILATEDSEYEVDKESLKMMGHQFDPESLDLNVPQLQGEDGEMQTGLSIEKYGRSAVVKAVPDDGSSPTSSRPQTTMGKSLSKEQRRADHAAGKSQGNEKSNTEEKTTQRAVDRVAEKAAEEVAEAEAGEMTSAELKAHLDAKGVAYSSNARKGELQKLVKANP